MDFSASSGQIWGFFFFFEKKKFPRFPDLARSVQIWKQDLHIWKTSQIWEIGPQIWPDLAASVELYRFWGFSLKLGRARVPNPAQVGGLRRNVRIPRLSNCGVRHFIEAIRAPGTSGTRIVCSLSTFITKKGRSRHPKRSHGTQHF